MGLAVLLVFRTRAKSNPAIVVGLAVFAYGLVGAYVLPWYLAWGLIPLALAYRSRSALALLFFAAVLHLGFVPDAARSCTTSRATVWRTRSRAPTSTGSSPRSRSLRWWPRWCGPRRRRGTGSAPAGRGLPAHDRALTRPGPGWALGWRQ